LEALAIFSSIQEKKIPGRNVITWYGLTSQQATHWKCERTHEALWFMNKSLVPLSLWRTSSDVFGSLALAAAENALVWACLQGNQMFCSLCGTSNFLQTDLKCITIYDYIWLYITIIYYDCILWLYIMIIYYDYIIWLSVTILYDYILWLCMTIFWLCMHIYILWLYMIIHYKHMIWLYILLLLLLLVLLYSYYINMII
jgi:hypothetical protein